MTSIAAISTVSGTYVPRPVLAEREELLARIEANERETRRLGAERLRLYAELLDIAAIASDTEAADTWLPAGERGDLEFRALRAEVATSLRITEYQVGREIGFAYSLTTQYWRVWEAVEEGAISERHARVIVDAGAVLGCGTSSEAAATREAYVREVLPEALTSTPAQLRPAAQRLAEQFAERPLDERHAEARTRRRVVVTEAEDGMADLYAHLPAVEAYAIKNRLMQMGRRVAQADRSRSRDEVQADIFTDLLLTAAPEGHSEPLHAASEQSTQQGTGLGSIRAQVQIIGGCEAFVCGLRPRSDGGSASTAIDTPQNAKQPRRQPAQPELVGYGPIDRASARKLAGHAKASDLITTDQTSGAVLTVERYRPTEEMRRLLGARDTQCRFPGCRVPLARCDLDHTIDAARGGPTATDNLAHLCRSHHRLKHHSKWRVQQDAGGVLTWISPAGRIHVDRPTSHVRFVSTSPPGPPPW